MFCGFDWRLKCLSQDVDFKLIGAAIAAGAAVPAFTKSRAPYVVAGEVVDYIGHHPGGFIGGQIVHEVGAWDGSAIRYFCGTTPTVRAVIWSATTTLTSRTSLVMCRATLAPREQPREVPERCTWFREQRFGETVAEAMRKLNFVGVRMPSAA